MSFKSIDDNDGELEGGRFPAFIKRLEGGEDDIIMAFEFFECP